MVESINAFRIAQTQFDHITELLNLDPQVSEILRWPEQEFTGSIPVGLDDGSTRMFTVFRIKHNSALGPTKGGLRFHPNQTLDSIRALAMWMTWKCAVVNIPRGGAQGGAPIDPTTLSVREQEAFIRGMTRRLYPVIGEGIDIQAPDFGANPQMMIWIVDEYTQIARKYSPGVATGKPVGSGGSLGRIESTGFGVVHTIREAMKHIQLNPIKSRAAIQGFGNVAQYAALGFTEHLGGKIVCVSYWDRGDRTPYTVFKDTGIDVRFLISITDIYGCIDKDKASVAGYRIEDADSWIRKDVDVLIPAALEGQINEFTVHEISDKVKIIAEGANGSTTPEADAVLKGTDIMLIPDFLCNAGGLVCSYLEEIQSTTQHWWRKNKVLSEVDQMMTEAFGDLIASAEREQLYYRDAAYLVAIERVVRAMHERGIV